MQPSCALSLSAIHKIAYIQVVNYDILWFKKRFEYRTSFDETQQLLSLSTFQVKKDLYNFLKDLSTFQMKDLILNFSYVFNIFSLSFFQGQQFFSEVLALFSYVIEPLKVWFQVTLCLITPRTYNVIALVHKMRVIATPLKP